MIYKYNDKFPTYNGIYKIYFIQNPNKVYIGSAAKKSGKHKSSNGFNFRWKNHLNCLNKNKHHSKKLTNAFNKYGIENMVFEILEICEPENAIILEQKYINDNNPFKNGYNSREKADSQLGFNHSKETIDKIIESKKVFRNKYKNEVISLYKDNLNCKEISSKIGISDTTIIKILNEANIKIKSKSFYNRIQVYQYNYFTGKFIRKLNSAYEGKKYDISDSIICRILKNKSIRHKEFYFDYEEMSEEQCLYRISEKIKDKKENCSKNIKKSFTSERKINQSNLMKGNDIRGKIKNIYQYDLDDNLIKLWIDSKEIVLHYNLKNATPILRCLKGERKKFKNTKWSLIKNK